MMIPDRVALTTLAVALFCSAGCGVLRSGDLVEQTPAHFSRGPQAEYERFLAQVAAEPGAVRTGSGLVYRELSPGAGDAPRKSDSVTVRFQVKTLAGRVVEDSAAYGGAVTVALDEVEPCMRESVLRMKPGGVSRFACPLPAKTDCEPCSAAVPAPLAVEATLVGVGQPLSPPGH